MIKSLANDAVSVLLSSDGNVTYAIPRYQRQYAWGKAQWEALFDDLLEGEQNGHFIGTIICVDQTQDATKKSVLELIDGQQRVTTISLLLAAIYDALNLSQETDPFDKGEQFAFDSLERMLALQESPGIRKQPEPRLVLQTRGTNHDDYLYILGSIGALPSHTAQKRVGNRQIMRAYRHFREAIEKRAETEGRAVKDFTFDLLNQVKAANVVKITVDSHSDAFTLFESLNNRGLDLTPIDLIKNKLMGAADRSEDLDIDEAYEQWNGWLIQLGDEYSTQDQFFRYFYNAMRDELEIAVPGIPVATRSTLIRIYEKLIDDDTERLMEIVSAGAAAYARLVNPVEHESNEALRRSFLRLRRAQGLPGHVLLLFLLMRQQELGIPDQELVEIADRLTAFFVRRNLTGTPPTYALVRLFMAIVKELRENPDSDRVQVVERRLVEISASDGEFLEILSGPMYDLNKDLTRFVLATLAENAMTRESHQDLWKRKGGATRPTYVWSIEHVLPQTPNLGPEWVEMLGGKQAAADAQEGYMHHLGNLTLSAYNPSLGKRGFIEKRDHKDSKGRPMGYKNGLSLNSDLREAETWNVASIKDRTRRLSREVLEAFPLGGTRTT